MPIKIHNHLIDKLAVVTGVFSGFALYPQVWAVLHGSHEGIAISTYVIIFCNSIVWLTYAIHRQLVSLVMPSILNMIAAGIVITWITLSP